MTYARKQQFAKRQRRDTSPYRRPVLRRQNAILNKQELKFFDTTFTTVAVDTSMELLNSVSSLNLVTQGDTASNRDGNIIEVKSLEYKFWLNFIPAAAATASTTVWFWIVMDRQPNGAAPAALTDIFTTNDAATCMPTVANQYRFKILRKEEITLDACAGVTTAYNNSSGVFKDYIKFKKPVQIRYNGNAGTTADVVTNNFFVVAGSKGSDDLVSVTGVTRIRFTG